MPCMNTIFSLEGWWPELLYFYGVFGKAAMESYSKIRYPISWVFLSVPSACRLNGHNVTETLSFPIPLLLNLFIILLAPPGWLGGLLLQIALSNSTSTEVYLQQAQQRGASCAMAKDNYYKSGPILCFTHLFLCQKLQPCATVFKPLKMLAPGLFTLRGTIGWLFGQWKGISILLGEFKCWYVIFKIYYNVSHLSPSPMFFEKATWQWIGLQSGGCCLKTM